MEVTVDPADRARLLEELRHLEARPGDHAAGAIRLPATDGTTTLRQVLREIDALGVHVTDIALRRPTLDDVFLSLTGHQTTDRKAA